MIVLYTDFGLNGPYVGQVKAVLARESPGAAVLDLMHDAPAFDPMLAAYLLAALVGEFSAGAVFLSVVDPGVGSVRRPLILRADERWFVGPDNGLFEPIARRARSLEAWAISLEPERLSASFHGRDLFAPVAAGLARGEPAPGAPIDAASVRRPDWPDDLERIVYIDRFGNGMTGMRAAGVLRTALIRVAGRTLTFAPTFSAVPRGQAFWYENANGLAEIAVNQGSAAECLGLSLGAPVSVAARR